jgi:hypothetical protein
MFGSSKRLEEKFEKEHNEQLLKIVEQNYKIGESFYYLGVRVTVMGHHDKMITIGKHSQLIWRKKPGVIIQWWTTTKEIRSAFISDDQLSFLVRE